MKVAFLFPGQGAQYPGMGKDFFDRYVEAREIFQFGDELLQRSLSKLIFEGPAEALTETKNSQTAIYLVSMALLHVLKKEFPALQPTVCAGLSLGEYTALTASKKILFETCLPLVQFRGEAMNAACETTRGTMAAIFGLSAEEIEGLVASLNLPQDLWVANFNCPGQTVVSGTIQGVEKGSEAAKNKGAKRVIPLKVHGAFHSGLMKLAEEKLAQEIQKIELLDSPIDLVMNVPGGYVTNSGKIRPYLIQQVTSPVRWEQSIRAMAPQVDLFIEIGCGKTLAGLNKQMGLIAPTISLTKVEDLENVAEKIQSKN